MSEWDLLVAAWAANEPPMVEFRSPSGSLLASIWATTGGLLLDAHDATSDAATDRDHHIDLRQHGVRTKRPAGYRRKLVRADDLTEPMLVWCNRGGHRYEISVDDVNEAVRQGRRTAVWPVKRVVRTRHEPIG